jgi:hypothetical protein
LFRVMLSMVVSPLLLLLLVVKLMSLLSLLR